MAVAIGIPWTIAVVVPRATTIAAVEGVVVLIMAEVHPPLHRLFPAPRTEEEEDAMTMIVTAVDEEEVGDVVRHRRLTGADAVVPVLHPSGMAVDAVAVLPPRRDARTVMIIIAAAVTVGPVVAVPVLLRVVEPVPSRIGTFTVEIVIVGIAGRKMENGKIETEGRVFII